MRRCGGRSCGALGLAQAIETLWEVSERETEGGARRRGREAVAEFVTRRRREWLERLDATGRYPSWVLLAVLAGMFATSFPFTILAVALGPIAEEFGVRETTGAARRRSCSHTRPAFTPASGIR